MLLFYMQLITCLSEQQLKHTGSVWLHHHLSLDDSKTLFWHCYLRVRVSTSFLSFFIDLQSQLLASRRGQWEQESLQALPTLIQNVGNWIDEGALQLIYCFKGFFQQLWTGIFKYMHILPVDNVAELSPSV